MSAPLLMLCASFLFAAMGLCIKLASALYDTAEIVFYRGLVGALFVLALVALRGGSLRTRRLAQHGSRSLTGVCALGLWFHALAGLPLATAMTLNYMSSIWLAVFLVGSAVVLRRGRADGRLVVAVLAGFAGVVLVLRPTLSPQQFAHAAAGLLSGVLAAAAYLQVQALGRAGEPEYRIVFYFSLGGMVAGALGAAATGGLHGHSARGVLLLLAIGLMATAGQIMMTRAYAIGRTLSNASLQYSGIAFSCVLGALVFDDPLTPGALAGIALIVAAGLAATWLRAQPPAPR